MKLGLDSYSYHLAFGAHGDMPNQHMTLPQFINRVAELGLDGFQIDPMHLPSKEEAYLREIVRQTQEKGLFLEYGAMTLQPESLQIELEICAKLGSSVLRTFAGFDRYAKSTNISEEMEKTVLALNQVKSKARALAIRIAVENHCDFSADELVQVIETVNSPWVGICLDLGNAMATWEEPLQAAAKMAPYAVTTHFKDHGVTMTYHGFNVYATALGEGIIPLPKALNLLKQKAHLDRVILEIAAGAETDEKQALKKEEAMIRRSVDYARKVLQIQ